MPELPEVETIKNQLNHHLPAKVKQFSKSQFIKSIAHTPLEEIQKLKVSSISRKGKMLIFNLSNNYYLLSHLGMTGTWRYSKEPLNEKHAHLKIILSSLSRNEIFHLTYVDPRRFGHMYLYKEKEAQKKLSELGVDLLDKEFTLDYFTKAVKRFPNRFIKVSLLDQSLFAGTGNYIANEICARAFVRPQRRIKTLTRKEITRLYEAVSIVLSPALQTGGTTFQGGYIDALGNKGQGVNHLVVFYQKTCQLCKATPIKKIVLAQRGTYYCPLCQK